MTYGYGIPILFPIAAASITILYLVEKTMLYYGYRLPPMYDERLSQSVINTLYYAPLFFLGFGYWMASNKQMLSNENLFPKDRMISPDESQHTIDRVFTGNYMSNQAWPLLALFCVLLFNQIFGNMIMACLTRCFPSLEIGDIDLDEDLDNYFASLDEKDRNWAIKENEYATKNLGLQLYTVKQSKSIES